MGPTVAAEIGQLILLLALVVTSSTHLGYLYTTEPVSPLLDSIENVKIPIENGKRIYRRLDDNWYVYYVRYLERPTIGR